MPATVPTIDEFTALEARVAALEAAPPPDPGPGPDPGPDPGPGPSPSGMSVCIAYAGADHVFAAADGVDRGDWTDARGAFVQGRIDATCPSLPAFTVQFRCDKNAVRYEVVFELGDTTVGATAANMTSYTATVYDEGEVLAAIDVPEHYWYSRWRWQSEPRPITGKIEDLQADGLLPRFDTSLATTHPLSGPKTYTPMGLAGLTAYMPSTGERAEIGVVTEQQAEYLRGDATPDSMIAQAEASGTMPWHYRNEDGGAVYDFKAHPNATLYYPANIPACGTPITLDPAHEPDLCYVPFLLTGDPYYLEEMQFAATHNVLAALPQSRGSYCIGFAVRAHAWALRTLAHCARSTPDDAPSWVQSRVYWQEWLDGNRDWMLSRYVHPVPPYDVPPFAVLHYMVDTENAPASSTMPQGTVSVQWMEDYEAAVLGHVVQLGYADWLPILEWKLVNTLARTNGTSGWARAKPAPYNVALRPDADAAYVQGWQECWDLNVQMQPAIASFDDPDTIPAGDSLTYASYTLSALALAATLGVEGAAEAHAWLRGQIEANSDDNVYVDRKWTISG